MIPELEKPKITEIKVRMDCNGCVQKIKKALHGINGIYDLYIDVPQQKLTIIGWADPEKIVKAIKKARKNAMICSHSEIPDPSPAQPTEQPPAEQQAPTGATLPEAAPPPAEPPKDQPAPENPTPDTKPTNTANDSSSSAQPIQPSDPNDVDAVHFIYYPPSPDHGYRYGYSPSYRHSYGGQWNNNPNYPRLHQEPGLQQATPQQVIHNYNTYKPSPSVTHTYNTYRSSPHFTEYNYIKSPPQYTYYRRPEHYSDDLNSSSNGNGNGNISSIFSDENPNACRIV